MAKRKHRNNGNSTALLFKIAALAAIFYEAAIHARDSAYILGGIVLLFAVLMAVKISKASKFRKSAMEINLIDNMSGEDFELALRELLSHVGYTHINTTPKSGDFGADLIMNDRKGNKIVVQAKRYTNSVKIDAVQQVHTAKDYYRADHAILITNSHVTKAGHELAARTGVEIWERPQLIQLISKAK